MPAGVFRLDHLLHTVAEPTFVPLELAEELLEGAWRHSRLQGDGLDALLRQVGQLSADIDTQVGTRILTGETIGEAFQEPIQFRFQLTNLLNIHARSSLKPNGKDSFPDSGDTGKVNLAL